MARLSPRGLTTNLTTGETTSTNQNVPGNNSAADISFEQAVEQRAQEIAEQIVRENAAALRRIDTGRVFTKFDIVNDIVENQKTVVTKGVFSGNNGTLYTFFTGSSMTAAQKVYYYEIYQSSSVSVGAEPQFAVAYGHRQGSGSVSPGSVDDAPTRAIYSQYRMLLLDPTDNLFTFGGRDSDDIYVINFNRARLKEKLDPGNWQLNLLALNGSSYANKYFTGSHVIADRTGSHIHLIDDSGDSQQAVTTNGTAGRVYNVISGTIENGPYLVNGGYVNYGLVYPDHGVIILNPRGLNASCSFNTVTGSDVAGDNAYKLFKSISGSGALSTTPDPDVHGFTARNAETITSTYYFVRVKNAEYNFSNNPSFTTGSVGEFSQPTFVNDPKVYVTTVGLYNDRQELLAVGKLSKPILKSFSNELLLKIKLDF